MVMKLITDILPWLQGNTLGERMIAVSILRIVNHPKISCGLDTTKSKPDPEVFLVAARKLELSPGQCLVVEDSAAGIEAAAAGGMKSLGVGPFYRLLHADYEAPMLCEVQNWDEILK